ncbi:MAG: COX15/CtaA family protein [Planctomycetota bacterium]
MSVAPLGREQMAEKRPSGIHRWALVTAGATFPLLMLGGIVTSLDVGLAVPDWPTTFGYQMFLYPIGKMLESTGVFWEHSHRLMGSLVGMLTIGLATWITLSVYRWRTESRRWIFGLGIAALVGVCIQGVLGGLRVELLARELAVVHGAFAQAFFCLVVGIAVVTSKSWSEAAASAPAEAVHGLRRAALWTCAFVYGQLVLGALVRHFQVTVLFHALGAIVVALACVTLRRRVQRDFGGNGFLTKPARRLVHLLGLQVVLGIVTWIATRHTVPGEQIPIADVVSATSHVLVGALLLMTAFVIKVRSHRIEIEETASEESLDPETFENPSWSSAEPAGSMR